MNNYLKLNLGSGGKHIPGWDNLDLNNEDKIDEASLARSIRWTAPYLNDYKNETVDFIYNEHFIEHLDEVDGFILLFECFRVLKKGGILRICTPSIDKYVFEFLKFKNFNIKDFRNSTQFLNYAIYGEGWRNSVGVRYIKNIEEASCEQHSFPPCDHRYIYSFNDLSEKLEKIGFSSIKEEEWGSSCHKALKGLENHPGRLELIIEAKK